MRPILRGITVVAAILALPLPTLAEPIVEPPRAEELVEGHVVFMTIDAYQFDPGEFNASATAPPASIASLAGEQLERVVADRFAGVLWFNDQYLVPPEQRVTVGGLGGGTYARSVYGAGLAVLVRADDGHAVREPCGGAVLAVNAGDPDPRHLLVAIDGRDPLTDEARERATLGVDTESPDVASDGLVTSQANGAVGDAGLLGFDYEESYRVMDPNGHSFIVDKYLATTRIGLDDRIWTTYAYPVWVVNMLGSPAFVPDQSAVSVRSGREVVGNDCAPFRELGRALLAPALGSTCGMSLESLSLLSTTGNPDQNLDFLGDGPPSWQDDPCNSYQEPSRGGYCYNGRVMADENYCLDAAEYVPRRYQAVLYFAWDDLSVLASPREHGNNWELDTNGCQSGTEWPCPGEEPWRPGFGADHREGNSHGFHPNAPFHEDVEACRPEFAGPNPTNHGGSTLGRRGVCDYLHATARVDVYYSGSGRPPEPLVRRFVLDDQAGSSDPYHDFYAAYLPE